MPITIKTIIFAKMRMVIFLINYFAIFIFTIFTTLFAQKKGDYLFPIKPNERNELTGTMGELRSNHFHGGLDVRTNNQIGFPVYAAAQGYVSRVAVKARGYGKVLYLKHANGTTTVYAHLDKFCDKIERYIRQIQYERQSFEVDILLAPSKFPILAGEEIAKSGNSGSSGGPHLHFEIRDTAQNQLNPLLFGFDEIVDTTPPLLQKIALVPMDRAARVEGVFERKEWKPYGENGAYFLTQEIEAQGKIAFELMARDKIEGSYFSFGINYIKVECAGTTLFEYHLTKLPLEHTRYMNRFINYETWAKSSERFMRCYVADGNCLESCKIADTGGILEVEDGKQYKVRIVVADSYGNESVLFLHVKGNAKKEASRPYPLKSTFEVQDSYLIFKADLSATFPHLNKATIYANYQNYALEPAYTVGNIATYLYDLRLAIPDSIQLPNQNFIYPNILTAIPSEADFKFYHPDFNLFVEKESLYDTLYLQMRTTQVQNAAGKNVQDWVFSHATIPLHQAVTLHLKTKEKFKNPNKVGAYIIYGKSLSYQGGVWQGAHFKFTTRTLGRFRLVEDTKPPKIQRVGRKGLTFRITDDLSGIDTYTATLNGEFILFEYDAKSSLLTVLPFDENNKLKGEFVLKVIDNMKNESILKIYI
ncbi:M23 family metallopeptidase [Hugenholtzia roseola]|uniref:M23 family metallopeptidase n=1 Tax=Hugenholtzia roseola TaxID=1002 RepID=UPI000419EBDA|nr:M23 family metallopeptidase [Hugenholtzia roseola]